jgi:UDPglucose--hexose-1-phosphate uridylyltransferase
VSDWRTLPHRRRNPLTGEWVLVSPRRLERPWQGETLETAGSVPLPPYDPACYLCPGNLRANGRRNPPYETTFSFDNDYAALIDDVPAAGLDERELLVAQSERGRCRVLCYTPRHDLGIAAMDLPSVRAIVDAWAEQYLTLIALPYVSAVTIFENRGSMMGASEPHPHAQIWADESVPVELFKETCGLKAYADAHGECLLCAYASFEVENEERLVYANEHVCIVVPFWAVWPFESLVLPRRHVRGLDELAGEERDAFADAMQTLTARYDRLFGVPFPYSMGLHQRPNGGAHDEWHLHAHYYPPLLRSATIRKYQVGYEMLAQPQRDFTPEDAARRLR